MKITYGLIARTYALWCEHCPSYPMTEAQFNAQPVAERLQWLTFNGGCK